MAFFILPLPLLVPFWWSTVTEMPFVSLCKNKKSISPLTHINEVISMMLEDNVCHLAVTEGDRLVGTVGFDDINKATLSLASTKVAA